MGLEMAGISAAVDNDIRLRDVDKQAYLLELESRFDGDSHIDIGVPNLVVRSRLGKSPSTSTRDASDRCWRVDDPFPVDKGYILITPE